MQGGAWRAARAAAHVHTRVHTGLLTSNRRPNVCVQLGVQCTAAAYCCPNGMATQRAVPRRPAGWPELLVQHLQRYAASASAWLAQLTQSSSPFPWSARLPRMCVCAHARGIHGNKTVSCWPPCHSMVDTDTICLPNRVELRVRHLNHGVAVLQHCGRVRMRGDPASVAIEHGKPCEKLPHSAAAGRGVHWLRLGLAWSRPMAPCSSACRSRLESGSLLPAGARTVCNKAAQGCI